MLLWIGIITNKTKNVWGYKYMISTLVDINIHKQNRMNNFKRKKIPSIGEYVEHPELNLTVDVSVNLYNLFGQFLISVY